MKNLFHYLLIIIGITPLCAIAQVKIGDNTPPVAGALLELSQGTTTSKGLGLPRVLLHNLNNLNDIDPTNELRPDTKEHIGLLVYNVGINNEECVTSVPGLYVWNGENWDMVGANHFKRPSLLEQLKTNRNIDLFSSRNSEDSQLYTVESDQSENIFIAAHYGNNVGTWMLNNLSAKNYSNNKAIILNPNAATTDIAYYAYPNSLNNMPPANYILENGLLYNWEAAKGTSQIENGKIQGICPEGWRIPTTSDWISLIEETYENNENYSFTTLGNPNNNDQWKTENGYMLETKPGAESTISLADPIDKVGAGTILKTLCKTNVVSDLTTNGLSNKLEKRGLELELNGIISDNHIYNYGRMGYFWAINEKTNEPAIFYVSAHESGIGKQCLFNPKDYVSVRCIKDN